MVGVGEMLAAAVIKEVVSKLPVLLQASVQGPVKSILSFKKHLNDMKMTLESINAVMADAEKRSINDEVERLWLKRLKQAAYEISDMFDEFQHGSPQGKLHNPSWSKIILSRDTAKKMKDMIKTLKNIKEQKESYGTRLVSSEPNNDAVEEQETISKVSGIIVGRRVEKQAVINILLSYNNEACSTNSYLPETSHCTVIHGLPGVGKTELAKLVFNDETILKVFPQRAWVSLHQNWHEKEIARAIISIIEGRTCNLEILESIYQHLKNVLQSRCLIVLDNLWDSGQLEKLKGILGCNVSILVTSRREIRLNMPKATLFALDPLSDDLSRDLVEQVASSYFPEGDIPKRAVEEIVEMCRGVPLALKCVASLLKPGRRVDELLSLIKTIFPPKSGYGTTGIRQTVFASLKLTYHLMSWRLKLCFAYCAIFPKGYEIDRENLCHQWIALGLTEKMYAEDSIRELLIVSFLQDSEPPGGFLLESPMGTDHYILPARSLRIIWSNDDRYWRLNSTPESRFALSMELIEVWWLEIEGCIPTEFLCTDTSYDIYLVYKLANEHNGLSWGKSYVKVDGSQTTGSQMVSFVDEDAVRVDCVAYPVTRSEGWMELWLGEFYNNHGDSEVKVSVSETTDAYAKRGLIIEGMELRMKSL